MFEKLIIVGRLGRDPEMRFTPGGQAVTSFPVAVDVGFGEKKETHWLRVTAWDKTAESCNTHLKKGGMVLVEGRLKADPDTGGPVLWTDKEGKPRASFEVTASTVRFLSSKPAADEAETDVPF